MTLSYISLKRRRNRRKAARRFLKTVLNHGNWKYQSQNSFVSRLAIWRHCTEAKVIIRKSCSCFFSLWNIYILKEYFPNLLEITLLPRFFVYWARYFKFWLLAYFLILLNCAKFEEDWTTFILDILQGSPLWYFLFL